MAKQREPKITIKTDLELWDDNNLQGAITRVPANCKILQHEMMARPYGEYVDRAKNSNAKADREEAELALRIVSWKIINLMRVLSGLPATDKLPRDWPMDELTRAGWGNDFTPSTNPVNNRNNQNTNSPRPGQWYRAMLLNWELVVARLKFWEPDVKTVGAEEIERIKSDTRIRKDALEALAFVDTMPKQFFMKTLRDYTGQLAAEISEANTAARKALEAMEPTFEAA